MRSRRMAGLVASVALGLVMAAVGPVNAAPSVVADWGMDEPAGAGVMIDASGNGIDGQVGTAVVTGTSVLGATAYRWPWVRPAEPPAKPERLVRVSDSRLNPDTRNYAVSVRFRTTHSFGNMIQKGQAGATGGYFKWEIPSGNLTCLFRGVNASGDYVRRAVKAGVALNDGAWHTARCERTGTGVTLTIDGGKVVRRVSGSTGRIANTNPLTIGGKLNCDQVKITCDYFAGDMDWVRIEKW